MESRVTVAFCFSRLRFDNHRNIVIRAHFDLIKCKL